MNNYRNLLQINKRIFSIILTSIFLILIGFSGPVTAFSILIGSPSTALVKSVVKFNVSLELQSAEMVKLTTINLFIDSSSRHPISCNLPLTQNTVIICDTKITGLAPSNVSVVALQIPSFGPYGFGSSSSSRFLYQVTWDTSTIKNTYYITVTALDGNTILKTNSTSTTLTK